VVRPDPIPNSAVKHSLADGSGCIASARVGCRQFFIQKPKCFTAFRLFYHLPLIAKVCILHNMRKTTATLMARKFSEFLGKVEHGQSIQILKHGRPVARLVPDCDFMAGKTAAALFANHVSDPETADAIERELARLKHEDDHALDNRY
jgi:prevent-host-death family protein